MKSYKGYVQLPVLLIAAAVLASGCSSSSNTEVIEEPVAAQDISGVWLGYIGSTFAVGIITTDDGENYYARFIGQDTDDQFVQFVSQEDRPLVQTSGSYIFTGDLDACFWDAGSAEDYATIDPPTVSVWSPGYTRTVLGLGWPTGAYQYEETGDTGLFAFIYNTTYDKVLPNVNDLSGQWQIENAFIGGNTLVLTIEPNASSTEETTLWGEDDRNNTFDGTIEIHYSPIDDTAYNVYDVTLQLNDSLLLTGLAAYVAEAHTSGINVNAKTLAIGAASADKTYTLTGLATQR